MRTNDQLTFLHKIDWTREQGAMQGQGEHAEWVSLRWGTQGAFACNRGPTVQVMVWGEMSIWKPLSWAKHISALNSAKSHFWGVPCLGLDHNSFLVASVFICERCNTPRHTPKGCVRKMAMATGAAVPSIPLAPRTQLTRHAYAAPERCCTEEIYNVTPQNRTAVGATKRWALSLQLVKSKAIAARGLTNKAVTHFSA